LGGTEERARKRTELLAATERAATQMNLGAVLSRLGERESGTAWLEAAVAAFDACLTIAIALPEVSVQGVRMRRDQIRAEIARRAANFGRCTAR
jgi:hypothetical protein